MLVNKAKFRLGVPELVILIISIFYAVGIRTWFAVCPVTGETVMACHWAGEALKAVSLVFAASAVIHVFVPDLKVMAGMDIVLICLAVLTVFLPGTVINLCGMADMACRSSSQPWTVAFGAAMALALAADIILCASGLSKAKHERKAQA